MKTLFLSAVLLGSVLGTLNAQVEDVALLAEEVAKTEKAMKRALQNLVSEIKKEEEPERATAIIEALKKSQSAWEKYADEQVAFVTLHGGAGGVGRQLGALSYRKELLEKRTADLKEVPNPF